MRDPIHFRAVEHLPTIEDTPTPLTDTYDVIASHHIRAILIPQLSPLSLPEQNSSALAMLWFCGGESTYVHMYITWRCQHSTPLSFYTTQTKGRERTKTLFLHARLLTT